MFDALNAAASGMLADRVWLDLTSANLANQNDVANGGAPPYTATEPVFAETVDGAGLPDGVEVSGTTASLAPQRQVAVPSAVPGTFAAGSNVDLTGQMLDLIAAGRAYQTNADAFKTGVSDDQAVLQI